MLSFFFPVLSGLYESRLQTNEQHLQEARRRRRTQPQPRRLLLSASQLHNASNNNSTTTAATSKSQLELELELLPAPPAPAPPVSFPLATIGDQRRLELELRRKQMVSQLWWTRSAGRLRGVTPR